MGGRLVTHLYPVNVYLSQAKESKGENQIECEKLKRNENKNSEFFLNLRTTLGRWCVELDYGTVVGISFLRNVKPNLVPQCNSTHPVPKTYSVWQQYLKCWREQVRTWRAFYFAQNKRGKNTFANCPLPAPSRQKCTDHGSFIRWVD